MNTVAEGWLKGSVIRTARKPHRCNYWHGLHNGGRCKHVIERGEQYVEGDPNDEAGGYGNDRYCLSHINEQS